MSPLASAPLASDPFGINPSTAQLAINDNAPSLTVGSTALPTTGSTTLVYAPAPFCPSTATVTVTGVAPTLSVTSSPSVPSGATVVTGKTETTSVGVTETPGTAHTTISGGTPIPTNHLARLTSDLNVLDILQAQVAVIHPSIGTTTQGDTKAYTPNIPVRAGASYQMLVTALAMSGFNGRAYIQVTWYAQDGVTVISTNQLTGTDYRSSPAASNTVQAIQGLVVAPANAVSASFLLGVTWPTTVPSAGLAYTAFPRVNLAAQLSGNIVSETGTSLTSTGTTGVITSQNVAAGFAGQGALATSSLTPPQVTNSLIPTAGQNRVPFSMFENAPANAAPIQWIVGYNVSGLATSWSNNGNGQGGFTTGCAELNFTATAAGQTVSIKSNYFPVLAGEQIAVEGLAYSSNATGNISIGFINSAGQSIGEPQVGTFGNGSYQASVQGMMTVPAGAVMAWYECYGVAVASGAGYIALARPYVGGVPTGQTTFPAFSPGPNSINGADITGQNVAASIAGQGSLATQNQVGTGSVTPNAITSNVSASSGTFNVGAANTAYQILSANTTTQGGPVLLSGSLFYNSGGNSSGWNTAGGTTAYLNFYRDGTLIFSSPFAIEYQTSTGNGSVYSGAAFSYVDNVGAGTHTYTLGFEVTSSQAPSNAGQVSNMFIMATELKR